jgi:hypothetical protein
MPIDMTALKDVLYSAVLSDLLDEFGHRDQAMRPFVRPLDENLPLFGRARTGIYMNTYSVEEGENVNRRAKLTPDRRAKLTPRLACTTGSARPGGTGRGCGAGASAVAWGTVS